MQAESQSTHDASSPILLIFLFYCEMLFSQSVAQIARHTGDYDRNQGLFCSETGLPAHVAFAAPMTV
jgi:hypothetical protein